MNDDKHLELGRIKNIHFVGIGGAGMCGIAEVLLHLGYKISGSDLIDNYVTQRLRNLGAEIITGHSETAVKDADVVVQSTAINDKNPEITAARKKRIPVVQRAEMLAELMRFRYGIAVAGTHGKTTTTSLIASILAHGGLDPTFVIGGQLNSAGCNARLGASRYIVAEADESDASFLYLKPMMSVVSNIDADHMQTYADNFKKLENTFVRFLHHLPFYGLAILCLDDPNIKQIIPKISRPIITYGFDKNADVHITNYQQKGLQSHFTVERPAPHKAIDITMSLPGKHNALNSLAAIIVATELGVTDENIQQALAKFAGIGRRFQVYGELNTPGGMATLIDDYGHHPSELEYTISSLREIWPKRRLLMVFQPHRYTRTKALLDEFATVLEKVDSLILMPVYSAGEEEIRGASSKDLFNKIMKNKKLKPLLVDDEKGLEQSLAEEIRANDVIVTQGAGSIGEISAKLAQLWKTK